jgi:hypothetical protein
VEGIEMSVEKSDLEAKLREIQGVVDESAAASKGAVLIAVAVVVAIALFFLLGKRKGRKGSALVEVFRLG